MECAHPRNLSFREHEITHAHTHRDINKAVVYIVPAMKHHRPRRVPACGEARISRLHSPRDSLPSSGHLPGISEKAHKKFRRDFPPRVVCKRKIFPSFLPDAAIRLFKIPRQRRKYHTRERGNILDFRAGDIPAWRQTLSLQGVCTLRSLFHMHARAPEYALATTF